MGGPNFAEGVYIFLQNLFRGGLYFTGVQILRDSTCDRLVAVGGDRRGDRPLPRSALLLSVLQWTNEMTASNNILGTLWVRLCGY